jgi:uncharacterized membrane protein YczE
MTTMWYLRYLLLFVGLTLFGISLGMIVEADLGLAPWDVFHQGLADRIGLSLGTTIVLTSFVVLTFWIPLRELPGVGTISNAVLIGLIVDLTTEVLPDISRLGPRWSLLIVGIALNGVASGMYIGARLGAGPRDGLMTGLARRGHSIRVVRTSLEVGVFSIGIVLGGSFGAGTIIFTLSIGPLAHLFIPIFDKMTREDNDALDAPRVA